MQLYPHEPALEEEEALQIGASRRLRGADSYSAAVAVRENAPLITWDLELVERAGGQTPTQWLASNG